MAESLSHDAQPTGRGGALQSGAYVSLALLLGINLFNYVDRYVLAAVEPDIQKQFFSASDKHAEGLMGLLATAFIISYMVMAPLFGWLADRMSRWVLIGGSVLFWSLATGASGLAWTFGILLITRLFVGVGEAGYGPAAPTLISDLFPIRLRGGVLACFYMAIPVGSALGYVIGGKIAAHFGWHWSFYAVVGPGILLGILCLFMRDPPRGRADAATNTRTARLADYWLLARTPSYVLDCLGMAAMTFAIGGISFWMPKYLANVRQIGTLDHVNFIFGAITAAAGLAATLAGGVVGDLLKPYLPSSYLVVSGLGIWIACPFILAMLFTPFPLAWVWIALAVFFLFFNTGPSNTVLANVTHPSIRATGFALNILVIHTLGDATSPPILGEIAGRISWNAAFYVVAAAMVLAGFLWLWGARYLAADTAAAPARLTA